MSIAQSILANPNKYSLAQLTQGVQNGVIPAYIGIPIIQEKMQEQARMQSMGQGQGQAAQPPVAEQIMAQAQQSGQGVESLTSNLPQEYAGGGIVAFEEGGPVERFQTGGTQEERDREAMMETLRSMKAAGMDIATLPGRGILGALESGVTRPLRAVGVPVPYLPASVYGGDASSMTPYMDALRKQRGETKPATATGIDKDLGPVPGTTDKDVLGGRPMGGGITALPGADRAPTAAGPGAGFVQKPMAMPPQPVNEKSLEQTARDEFAGLGERSDTRLKELIEAQSKNKMEGKAFDSLKKSLEDEAAQAGAEKSSAKNMAIFKAGLAIMGGTSRNALENIGKGAMVGAEDYQKAAADLKKADKERQKQFAAIEEARRAEDRDDIKTRNSQLDKAYTAKQRTDELGIAAIMSGTGKDRETATEIWKTQFSGAATQRAAETSAAATRYSADVGASSRIQAAETKALLAGLGGGKGALTQDQLIKNRQALADSPQIAEYKKQLIAQYGKNVVNQPGYQENINQRIDQLLMQMAAQPGASMGLNITPAQQSLISKYLNPR